MAAVQEKAGTGLLPPKAKEPVVTKEVPEPSSNMEAQRNNQEEMRNLAKSLEEGIECLLQSEIFYPIADPDDVPIVEEVGEEQPKEEESVAHGRRKGIHLAGMPEWFEKQQMEEEAQSSAATEHLESEPEKEGSEGSDGYLTFHEQELLEDFSMEELRRITDVANGKVQTEALLHKFRTEERHEAMEELSKWFKSTLANVAPDEESYRSREDGLKEEAAEYELGLQQLKKGLEEKELKFLVRLSGFEQQLHFLNPERDLTQRGSMRRHGLRGAEDLEAIKLDSAPLRAHASWRQSSKEARKAKFEEELLKLREQPAPTDGALKMKASELLRIIAEQQASIVALNTHQIMGKQRIAVCKQAIKAAELEQQRFKEGGGSRPLAHAAAQGQEDGKQEAEAADTEAVQEALIEAKRCVGIKELARHMSNNPIFGAQVWLAVELQGPMEGPITAKRARKRIYVGPKALAERFQQQKAEGMSPEQQEEYQELVKLCRQLEGQLDRARNFKVKRTQTQASLVTGSASNLNLELSEELGTSSQGMDSTPVESQQLSKQPQVAQAKQSKEDVEAAKLLLEAKGILAKLSAQKDKLLAGTSGAPLMGPQPPGHEDSAKADSRPALKSPSKSPARGARAAAATARKAKLSPSFAAEVGKIWAQVDLCEAESAELDLEVEELQKRIEELQQLASERGPREGEGEFPSEEQSGSDAGDGTPQAGSSFLPGKAASFRLKPSSSLKPMGSFKPMKAISLKPAGSFRPREVAIPSGSLASPDQEESEEEELEEEGEGSDDPEEEDSEDEEAQKAEELQKVQEEITQYKEELKDLKEQLKNLQRAEVKKPEPHKDKKLKVVEEPKPRLSGRKEKSGSTFSDDEAAPIKVLDLLTPKQLDKQKKERERLRVEMELLLQLKQEELKLVKDVEMLDKQILAAKNKDTSGLTKLIGSTVPKKETPKETLKLLVEVKKSQAELNQWRQAWEKGKKGHDKR